MNTNWGMEYDLNQTNVTHRKTILHWAAETSAVNLVDELFAAGVGFTLQDVYSEPPPALCCRESPSRDLVGLVLMFM
ncbi:hypothetical protein N7453_011284 [Penicillium expansum]|nr:hypothetical protein N7453_011284 [Penicillium expansum]